MQAMMMRMKQKKAKKAKKKQEGQELRVNSIERDPPPPDPDAVPKKSFCRDGGPADGCFYLFFVGIFIGMAVSGRSRGDLNYSQTESLRNKLIEQDTFGCYNCEEPTTFEGIRTVADVYYYIEDVLFPGLFNNVKINGSKITDPTKQAYVSTQSRLLAGFRVRQVRMKEEDCIWDDGDNFTECWSTSVFSTDDFEGNGKWSDDPYTYTDSEVLEDQGWTGRYGTYAGGGYIQDFLVTDTTNRSLVISELINGDWIDGGTRAVLIDFTTFNPSSLVHTVVRLAVEMPGGGVFPYYEFKSWVFLRYFSSEGGSLLVLNLLFGLCVCIRTFGMFWSMFECKIICRPKFQWIAPGCKKCRCCRWFKKGWNKFDCIIMLLFYMMIMLFIANLSYTNSIAMTNIYKYQSFRRLQYIFKTEANLQAVSGLLLLMKMFKYLGVNKKFQFLFTMFAESSQGLIVFFIVLGVFFMSFGMAGYLLFCSDVRDFRSFSFAMANMIRYTVAELDYSELSSSSASTGSLYYFGWSLLMLLVLANVFVAILSEAYVRVASTLEDDEEIPGIGGLTRMMSSFGRKAKSMFLGKEYDDVDMDGDGLISVDELAAIYKIPKEEAQKYIDKYDTDGDGQLSKEEFEKWMALERASKASSRSGGAGDDGDGNGNDNTGGVDGQGQGVEIVRLRSASNSMNYDGDEPDGDEETVNEKPDADIDKGQQNTSRDTYDEDEDEEKEQNRGGRDGNHLAVHNPNDTDLGDLDDLVNQLASGRSAPSESVQM